MYAAEPNRRSPTQQRTRVPDWTTEATDLIEHTVAVARDRTVVPARIATRAVVYGLLAALIALPAIIMLTVGAFRGLVLLYQGRVWAAYITLGGIFIIGGLFSWSKRKP
jgi:hypothetical protein